MANICFNWYINQIPRNLSKSKVNKCKESHTLYANWWKTELKAIGYINPDGQQKNDGCLLIKINKGQKIMKSHGTRKKKSVNLEFYIQKNYSSNMKAKYRHFKTYKNWRKLSPADISYKKKKNSSSCWESIAEREISWFHRNRNMRKCKYVGKYKEFKIFTYFIQLSLNLFKWLVTKIWKNLFYNLYLKVYNNKSVNIGILVIVTKYIIFN